MKWVLTAITVLSMWPTARSLIDSHLRCSRLREREVNGLLKRECHHNRWRELVRLVKHGILVGGVILAFIAVPLPFNWDRVQARTAVMIVVSWMLGFTSLWDRRYTRRLEADLARRE